jgi:hypothetical protein
MLSRRRFRQPAQAALSGLAAPGAAEPLPAFGWAAPLWAAERFDNRYRAWRVRAPLRSRLHAASRQATTAASQPPGRREQLWPPGSSAHAITRLAGSLPAAGPPRVAR